MIEALSYPFMQRALLAGLLTSLLAGWFGVFVVQRRLSFMGSGLAHAAFGGVAIGVFLGTSPLWVAVPFTVAAALGIVWVQQRTTLTADTAIGVFLSLSMALGIVLLSKTDRYSTEAFSILFGSILALRDGDVWAMVAVCAAAVLTWPAWGRWAYATFDRELASSDKVPVGRDDYLLAVCLAVTIVVAMKIVGMVLVGAFLVIPPATARLLSRRFAAMTVLSMALGVVSAALGVLLSWPLEFPAGATIILVQSAIFGGALFFRRG